MDTVDLVVSARSKLTDQEYDALREVILSFPRQRLEMPSGLSLPEAIRARRDELGLSRTELARRTGVSYSYMANIETGTRTPSLMVANRLQVVLGMNFSLFRLDTK